jgi:hypothetical protein
LHLVQILIPTFDNAGQQFGQSKFEGVRLELIERFGGLTAFVQSLRSVCGRTRKVARQRHDNMILIEVMSKTLDRAWWSANR